ncbi:MAG: SufD family Fe-S cluster assembly protein [Muribaculaceae bacterium]|nr:SufD family Fe-S cluster assembly protein [Muribaculaceae bacterium]
MENSLRQYIDLYHANRDELDARSAPVINTLRPQAVRVLEEMTLPRPGADDYEVIDLPSILGHDYGVNIRRVPLSVNPAESFHCGVPRMSTALFMLVNDRFGRTPDSLSALPEGVEVESLAVMARKRPEVVADYYGRLAMMENPIVALSTLLAQDGLWIRIPKGVKVERPIQLVEILGGADNLMAVRRVVIVAEEQSDARLLICDHTIPSARDMMALQTIEIYAEAGARFEIYDLEESAETTRRLSSLWLRQEKDSHVLINGMTIYNGVTRNEYHTRFAAPGSSLRLFGMGIADKDRLVDTYSRVDHDYGHCHTEELFKFSVDDLARCAFTGLVKVAAGAEKTEAYQSNRNLIGSDAARMFSKPQLEIYNDDVKCSHGSATGRLDEMQLFYMRTRGLDEETARLLLKQAFMADVIDKVEIPGLRERLTHMVERRFAGESAGCHDCNSECPTFRN